MLQSLVTRLSRACAPRMLLLRLQPVRDELGLPFKILRMGHLPLLAYTTLLGGLSIYGAKEARSYLQELLVDQALALRLAPSTSQSISLAITVIISYLTAACCLVCLCLPVRILWIHGKLPFGITLKESLYSVKQILRGTFFGVRASLRTLLPAIVMISLYLGFVRSLPDNGTYRIYVLACLLVVSISIWKAFPVLLSPLLIIGSQWDAQYSVTYAESVLRARAFDFLAITSACLGLLALIDLGFHRHISFQLPPIASLEAALYIIVLWYALMMMTFTVLRALAALPKR